MRRITLSETLPRTPAHRALLLMTASAICFGAMAFEAKVASARLSGPQVAFIRFAVGLLPPLLITRYRRPAFKVTRWDLIFYRGFFGGVAVLLYFLAIEHIKVGVATLLNYTAPIFSGIFSTLFIGEKISPKVLIPMPVALFGIFLVVHGNAPPGDLLGFGRWELVALCSAISSGIAVTSMRAARRSENSWAVYTSFCLLGLLTCSPLALADWKNPTPGEWVSLGLMSIFAIGAQLLMTFSLRWVDAMTVGVISQLAVLVSLTLGATILNERISGISAAGVALTLAGVIGVVYVTTIHQRSKFADEVAPES